MMDNQYAAQTIYILVRLSAGHYLKITEDIETEPWRNPVWGPEEVKLSHDPGGRKTSCEILGCFTGM